MNWAASREITLVVGQSGSGKTTFALRYLVNCQAAVRFVWDADGQLSDRLGLPAAETLEECALSLASGWVVFQPRRHAAEEFPRVFDAWARWVWETSGRLRGRKVLLVDEVWRYCTPSTIPGGLSECVLTGRVRELDCLFCTQHPNKLHGTLTGETTEAVSFCLTQDLNLRPMISLGHDPEELRRLVKGEWVSRAGMLIARGSLFGRVRPLHGQAGPRVKPSTVDTKQGRGRQEPAALPGVEGNNTQ